MPEKLKRMTEACVWSPIYAPYSGASTYRLDQQDGSAAFLKICPVPSREPLFAAKLRMDWLEGKISAPRVLFYDEAAGFEYMVSTAVAGFDAADKARWGGDLSGLVRLAAQGLKSFHRLPAEDCPFNHTLSTRLAIARDNLLNGTLDLEHLGEKYPGQEPERLFDRLEAGRTEMEDEVVVNHGDYSMPNVMVQDGRISGFIDLGSCGLADKYFDLAVAAKSIVRNYGEEYLSEFYREYGIANVDQAKIRYYQLLECFL